jgi:hypothetical protein
MFHVKHFKWKVSGKAGQGKGVGLRWDCEKGRNMSGIGLEERFKGGQDGAEAGIVSGRGRLRSRRASLG